MKSSTEGGVCSWTIVRPQFLHFGQITLIINHSFKAANHTKRHFHSNSARPYIQQCGVQFFMNRGYITCIAEPHTILHICVFLFSILGNAVNTKGRHQLKKNVFFWALPKLPNPPPMTPIRATWSSFFGSRNSRFESQFRT